MLRIIDLALKDWRQLVRDRRTFMFLLLMPIAFTLLFGYAFGGFGNASDERLPIGFLDRDQSWLSRELQTLLTQSSVLKLSALDPSASDNDLQKMIGDKKVAGTVIVPSGYAKELLTGKPLKIIFLGDTASAAGITIQSELLTAANRIDNAVRTALVMERFAPARLPFSYAFRQTLAAWEAPPIVISETTSSIVPPQKTSGMSLAHTSPGMMLQFAIAGLLTCAQIIVAERKARALQRLLTTATARIHILLGHYLAIFGLLFSQFIILILFGQFALKVDYLRNGAATFLIAFTAALCLAALGLLIGILAKTDEQAITFSLVCMFLFAGLGGAWVPLEVTGATFQTIGHLTPVAWAMDGFKNVVVRGLDFSAALLPALALASYAAFFLVLAAWRLQTAEEK